MGDSSIKKGPWTVEEDKLLISYITRYGQWNWSQLPKFAGLKRRGTSCRHRWINYLCPKLKRGNITIHKDRVQELSGCSLSTERLPAISENKEETHGHANPEKQSAGKKKAVEFHVSSGNNLECSWPLLSESSDEKDRESDSGSDNFSGPS